jgi:hypothetical protein
MAHDSTDMIHSNTSTVRVVARSKQERYKQYLICKERGHGPTEMVLTSNPPWNVCSLCGTHWRNETTMLEHDAPKA